MSGGTEDATARTLEIRITCSNISHAVAYPLLNECLSSSGSAITTRNGIFTECKLLCRVSKIGHSAKNCTRQKRALDKGLLCRVLGSWQKRGTRHRLPRVTVFGHVLLCRVPAVRHSAKIFFKKILGRVPLTRRSAKIQYFF